MIFFSFLPINRVILCSFYKTLKYFFVNDSVLCMIGCKTRQTEEVLYEHLKLESLASHLSQNNDFVVERNFIIHYLNMLYKIYKCNGSLASSLLFLLYFSFCGFFFENSPLFLLLFFFLFNGDARRCLPNGILYFSDFYYTIV
jgi:hypothetical protein